MPARSPRPSPWPRRPAESRGAPSAPPGWPRSGTPAVGPLGSPRSGSWSAVRRPRRARPAGGRGLLALPPPPAAALAREEDCDSAAPPLAGPRAQDLNPGALLRARGSRTLFYEWGGLRKRGNRNLRAHEREMGLEGSTGWITAEALSGGFGALRVSIPLPSPVKLGCRGGNVIILQPFKVVIVNSRAKLELHAIHVILKRK